MKLKRAIHFDRWFYYTVWHVVLHTHTLGLDQLVWHEMFIPHIAHSIDFRNSLRSYHISPIYPGQFGERKKNLSHRVRQLGLKEGCFSVSTE